MDNTSYNGDDISLEEMPQGCVISGYGKTGYIVIASTQDALAVIKSLQKMLKIQSGEQMFNILENHYMIDIPTDPEQLADLLDVYARDWAEVLHFLDTVSRRRGITLETPKVVEIMKRKLGIE